MSLLQVAKSEARQELRKLLENVGISPRDEAFISASVLTGKSVQRTLDESDL
jgi:ABC-type histidine transport system ATPase subunit